MARRILAAWPGLWHQGRRSLVSGRVRLCRQAQYFAPADRQGLPYHRCPRADAGRRRAGAQARRFVPVEWAGRPRTLRLRNRKGKRGGKGKKKEGRKRKG